MKKIPLFLVCALFAAFATFAAAMEIPDGLETNLEMGEFGKNEYVDLKTLVVRQWWNSEEEGEKSLIGAVSEFREPEHDDEPPEKITFTYGIWDPAKKDYVSELKAYSITGGGGATFKWDMRGKDGKKVPDGVYRVVLNISGEHYGNPLKGGAAPLYVTSGGPVVENEAISSRRGVLEYDGAPEIKFTTRNVNAVAVVDYDNDGNELGRWERVLPAGTHKFKSDLRDGDDRPFAPGKYATGITVGNPFGEEKEFKFHYTLDEPDPLEVAVKMNAGNELLVDENTAVPYTVSLNQGARVVVEHLSDGGAKNLIGASSPEKPEFLLAKGSHDGKWSRRPNSDKNAHYSKGSHWIRVTATSLTGERKTAETHKVTLAAKPQEVKRAPNLSLELSPDYVRIGGRMQTRISYSLDLDGHVYIALHGRGKLLKDIVYQQMKKGKYSTDLGVDNLDEGSYKIVLTVKNNHGTRKIERVLSVGWRR